MNIPAKFISYAKELGCVCKCSESMKKHTTFKIGGDADLFVTVFSLKQLCCVLKKATECELPVFVIGNGSNLLVSDEGVRGVVIKLQLSEEITLSDDGVLSATAGVRLSNVCLAALQESFSGLEFAWGIPGTVGGAIYMNAGAYGGEIKNILLECTAVDKSGNLFNYNNEEAELAYRESVFKRNGQIIVSAKFKLSKGEKIKIKREMDDLLSRRRDKQPLDMPNAGSVFKRPQGNFAGTLIEQCGLKGYTVGGASVSSKHAGFIVNNGNATCKDVLDLIEYIKKTVFEKTGVLLEQEIAVFGS